MFLCKYTCASPCWTLLLLCREQAELAKLFYMEMAADLKSMKLESQQIADSLRKTEENLRKAAERRKSSSEAFCTVLHQIETFHYLVHAL